MKYLTFFFVAAAYCSSATAQVLDVPNGYMLNGGGGYVVSGAPDGSLDSLDQCHMNGASADGTIAVRVQVNGLPAQGVAKERIRLVVGDWTAIPQVWRLCPTYINPDADSDASGMMYITGPIELKGAQVGGDLRSSSPMKSIQGLETTHVSRMAMKSSLDLQI